MFAAYLLGFDSSREEHAPLIEKSKAHSPNSKFQIPNSKADFADGGDDKLSEKAGPLELRFDVPPSEAIDYFKRKKVLPAKEFYALEKEARAAAFTVSGINRQDVLEAFRLEIENALSKGTAQKAVIDNFKKILAGAGHKELGDFHLETVFRTNMITAYGVGRRQQMEETAELLPFWQRSAVGDNRTRPSHLAMDGITLPANHPFWDTHYPPDGFNCRCTVSALLDLPDGYNPAKPNPDSTIVYDEDGLPAKAEYLTQVVDLSAGKFVGVPKQNVSLQETIETAARAADTAKGRTRLRVPQNPDAPRRILKPTEKAVASVAPAEKLSIIEQGTTGEKIYDLQNQMRSFKREHAIVFDRAGAPVFYKIGSESEVEVALDGKQTKRAVGGLLLHNHPDNLEFAPNDPRRDGGTFSPHDLLVAATYKIEEMFAVSKDYRYYAFPNSGQWTERMLAETTDGMTAFEDDYEYYLAENLAELDRKLRSRVFKTARGQIRAVNLLFRQAQHKTYQTLSKLYDFAYIRAK